MSKQEKEMRSMVSWNFLIKKNNTEWVLLDSLFPYYFRLIFDNCTDNSYELFIDWLSNTRMSFDTIIMLNTKNDEKTKLKHVNQDDEEKLKIYIANQDEPF